MLIIVNNLPKNNTWNQENIFLLHFISRAASVNTFCIYNIQITENLEYIV